MSIIYPKAWVPFIIINDPTTVPLFLQVAARISSLTLYDLCRLYWLSKSYDWIVNFDYSNPEFGSGTVTGSGTQLVENFLTYPRGTGALPGERTGYFSAFPYLAPQADPITGNSYNFALSDTGSDGFSPPDTELAGMGFQWFYNAGAFDAAFTRSGSNYISYWDASFFCGLPTREPFTFSTDSRGELATGLSLTLKINGVPDILIPLYFTVGLGWTLTGTISVNFNNFWAP